MTLAMYIVLDWIIYMENQGKLSWNDLSLFLFVEGRTEGDFVNDVMLVASNIPQYLIRKCQNISQPNFNFFLIR